MEGIILAREQTNWTAILVAVALVAIGMAASTAYFRWEGVAALNQERTAHVAQLARQKADFDRQVAEQSTKLKASEGKNASHESAIDDILQHGSDRYNQIGRATVLLTTDRGSCHSPIVSFRGENIILTASHCVRDRETHRRMDGESKVFYYYEEEKPIDPHEYYYMAYGSLKAHPATGHYVAEQVVTASGMDTAYIRGLPELQTTEMTKRALTIADTTPSEKSFVFSTHWQPYCWQLKRGEPCVEGEMLFFNLGIAKKISFPTAFFDYFLTVYGGDSGSGIIDQSGKLVGIVSASPVDKAREPINTKAPGPRSIRSFLESTWNK